MRAKESERLARVADSAARLYRIAELWAEAERLVPLEGTPDEGIASLLRNELNILWRRSLVLWFRLRWWRLAAWLDRR